MFVIDIKSYPAPSSKGGKYRRPVVLRIYNTKAEGTPWHWSRGLKGGRILQVENLDSRYTGPKSKFGQWLKRAKEMCQRYNETEFLDL